MHNQTSPAESKILILDNRAWVESDFYRYAGAIKMPEEACSASPSPSYHVEIEGSKTRLGAKITVTRSLKDGHYHTLILETRATGEPDGKGGYTPCTDHALSRINAFFMDKKIPIYSSIN